MSGMSEDQALELGHECAMTALKAERENVAQLPPPERLYWWFGFLTAALGAASASLGEPAARALSASLAEPQDAPASSGLARSRAEAELVRLHEARSIDDEPSSARKRKS